MDWTTSSRVKIERAKEHIAQLEAAVEAFRETKPYTVIGEPEPETGKIVFRVKISADPPARIGAIVGDVIHNIRSALDVLICQMYETATGRQAPPLISRSRYTSTRSLPSR